MARCCPAIPNTATGLPPVQQAVKEHHHGCCAQGEKQKILPIPEHFPQTLSNGQGSE